MFEIYNGVAKITINRPEVYNAFRPETNIQMLQAIEICRERDDIDIVLFTGTGDKAFCSGGDQNVKGIGWIYWRRWRTEVECSRFAQKDSGVAPNL